MNNENNESSNSKAWRDYINDLSDIDQSTELQFRGETCNFLYFIKHINKDIDFLCVDNHVIYSACLGFLTKIKREIEFDPNCEIELERVNKIEKLLKKIIDDFGYTPGNNGIPDY